MKYPVFIRLRAIGIVLLAVTVAACGGGGDDAPPPSSGNPPVSPPVTPPVTPPTTPPTTPPATPPPTPQPPPEPPTASLSRSGIQVSGDNRTGSAPIIDESVILSLSNSSGDIWTRTSINGDALAGAAVSWQSLVQAKVRIGLFPPTMLEAGTHTASVKLEVCSDALCAQQIAGSPFTVAITFEVTGTPMPRTQMHWSPQSPPTNLVTADTQARQFDLRVSVSDLAVKGLWLRRSGSATGLVTSVVRGEPTFTSTVGSSYALYTITLKPAAALGSGLFTDQIVFQACFDPECEQVLETGTFVLSLDIMVTATHDVEVIRHGWRPADNFAAVAVGASPAGRALYAAITKNEVSHITRIDGRTMAVDPAVDIDLEQPEQLRVSDDHGFLYMASRTEPVIKRLALPSLAEDLSVPLGQFNEYNPYLANDLLMLPGEPRSFVVATRWSTNHGGVHVYDDGVRRANSLMPVPQQGFELARWLVPAAVPGSFLSSNYGPAFPQVHALEQLQVDGGGITLGSSVDRTGGVVIAQKPVRSGTRLISLDGKVFDIATGVQTGALQMRDVGTPYAMVADEARGRLFLWAKVRQRDMIISYDLATLEFLAFAPVYAGPASSPGTGRSMTLWEDGVALTDGVEVTVLSGDFFSTYRGDPTM